MSAFTDNLAITPSGDLLKKWKLVAPLYWDLLHKGSGLTITVPTGYESDLATVPPVARILIDTTDPALIKAAILHDFLLDDLTNSRLEAAAVFHDALRAGGWGWFSAAVLALDVWVWTAWLGPLLTGREGN